jgi:hypothetical protein
MEKQKSESDRKLIANLTGVEPLDWCKRENGNLVYLNQAGQKFVLTPADIEMFKKRIEELVPKAKAILEAEQKSRSHHKKVLDSMPEVKELTEEQAPYDVEPTPEEKSLGELGQIEADDL